MKNATTLAISGGCREPAERHPPFTRDRSIDLLQASRGPRPPGSQIRRPGCLSLPERVAVQTSVRQGAGRHRWQCASRRSRSCGPLAGNSARRDREIGPSGGHPICPDGRLPLRPRAARANPHALSASGRPTRAAAAHRVELTVEHSVAAQRGRVYLDPVQNGFGQTVVGPYAVRRREACRRYSSPSTALPLSALVFASMRARARWPSAGSRVAMASACPWALSIPPPKEGGAPR